MVEVKKILFPVSLQPISEHIVPHVAYRMEKFGAEAMLIHVVPSTQVLADYYHLHPERVLAQHQVTAEAQQLLTNFRSKHLSSCHERVLIGNAADVIVEYARDKDFDMIIMGTHGRRGLERFTLGSVAARVLKYSTVPVLIINPFNAE